MNNLKTCTDTVAHIDNSVDNVYIDIFKQLNGRSRKNDYDEVLLVVQHDPDKNTYYILFMIKHVVKWSGWSDVDDEEFLTQVPLTHNSASVSGSVTSLLFSSRSRIRSFGNGIPIGNFSGGGNTPFGIL